jgi:F0F1-type ATP synthase assembly protein I
VENQEKQTTDTIKGKVPTTKAELVSFAFEVGSAIAVPLVVFALGGRVLDRNFDTGHLFLIAGLLLSLISTGIIIYKKVKNFI